MAVPVMVRFDDDVAEKLRERAHIERKSLNRVVNDVVRQYLDSTGGMADGSAPPDRAALAENVGQRLEEFLDLLKPLNHQENQRDLIQKILDSLIAAGDCLTAIHLALAPESIPTIREVDRDEVYS